MAKVRPLRVAVVDLLRPNEVFVLTWVAPKFISHNY